MPNKDPEQRRACLRRYYERHREEEKARSRAKAKRTRPALRIKQRQRYANHRRTDPTFRLICNMRSRLHKALAKGAGNTFELVGCQLSELRQHLEAQFTVGMTWANYGSWHVDHVKPLSQATSCEELASLCHYTNLQPLWARDNLRKGARQWH